MIQAFEKAVCFTDIHFGKKSNDKTHNDDCMAFIDWVIAVGKEQHCETCIFLGDWHDNRSTLHVGTLNYSHAAMEKLNENFDKVYFIVGNHDLFYRERRDVSSVIFSKNLDNFVVIDHPTTVGDVLFCPWLVGAEWKNVRGTQARYVFGHFELPNFLLNGNIRMPDHGELSGNHLAGAEYVFSGHFHKRQNKGNVWYIGNAFPHDFSDNGDIDRGCMVLSHGGKPEFINWVECPRYNTVLLSELVEDPNKWLFPKCTIKAAINIELSFEEAQFLREELQETYQCRRLDLVPMHIAVDDNISFRDTQFKSVDDFIIAGINAIDDDAAMDKELLVNIFNTLV